MVISSNKLTTIPTYLGQTITSNGKCDDEILKKIEIARGALNSMLKTIAARHISRKTRKIIINAYVWSTLWYGCETWTITTRKMTKLQSFEMWDMIGRWWKYPGENKTNEEVLKMTDEQLYIIPTIMKIKIINFGHMIRRSLNTSTGWYWAVIGGENKQRKAKNGVDDKYHRVDGNEIWRPHETGSRLGAMEDHDSQPSYRRRQLMMVRRNIE